MDARAAAALLDELGRLSAPVERSQTFMEIGGYPHYENVCSNFLRFFLDPARPHGLGSLFVDALLDSVGVGDWNEDLGGNISVEREASTAEGNRIDILIKSDSHAVLIENKICAAVANPFDDYAEYLNNLKNENREAYAEDKKIKILLTLYPPGEGSDDGFRNLTHADFASAVRSRLGYHVSEADIRYLTLMLDFLNTLERLGKGTRMNQEFINLLAKSSDELEKFLIGIKQVRDEARGKVQRLGELIDLKDCRSVQQLPWQPNPNYQLTYLLQHRVPINEESYVVIEPAVSPSGWKIRIYYRVPQGAQNRLELENLLNENEIPPENEPFVHPKQPDYDDEDLESIAAVVQEELSRIAGVVQEIVDKVSRSGS